MQIPARVSKRWLRGLSDAELEEVERLLCGSDTGAANASQTRTDGDRWQRAYDELQRRRGARLNTTSLLSEKRPVLKHWDLPLPLLLAVREALWGLLDGGVTQMYEGRHGNTYVGDHKLADLRRWEAVARQLDDEMPYGSIPED